MNETNIIFLVTSFSARCAIKPIFIDFYRLRNVFNRLKTRFSQFQKKHPHILIPREKPSFIDKLNKNWDKYLEIWDKQDPNIAGSQNYREKQELKIILDSTLELG